ncbi:unnamed protein product [Dracunculus medinensis]|uniref:Mannosyltransferase n=1 Tax=Dracunculus medinensis TaxID=318479 RepID=A0A0N4UGS9_DRAME|nr:unnamed protein product [Dracunculus medinensis]
MELLNLLALSFLLDIQTFKKDKRRLILFGIGSFIAFHIINLPWTFYTEKLDYIKLAPNSTNENTSYRRSCSRRYIWCDDIRRIPLRIYIFSTVVLSGLGFPFMSSPTGSLLSEILGPGH